MKQNTEIKESTSSVEFWIKMFKPRTQKYQRETLRRLKKSVSSFETVEENANKIKALQSLL